ncbi:glucosamine-6-phosphate deaminase [Eubacteriales bacterium OttesenSCG-928-A19]|nr:glucosamine-6-phosphate deaminase [Eubacteriales bacterium OttesenSCG-928-A19]
MNVIICKDLKAQGKAAASLFAAQMLAKRDSVLGFATGSSPLGTYDALAGLHARGALDFSSVRTFNLDEYVGMDPAHEQSYRRFMTENLFSRVNMPADHYRLPDGLAKDLDAECAAYEQAIRDAGGIDMQLLGIGHNGHIGFNEPGDTFPDATHVVSLSERTIEANKRFFASADEVPRQAISMGIGTIMRARAIVLIIGGAEKADITRQALYGPVTPLVPASILQFHQHVTVVLDEAAASKL